MFHHAGWIAFLLLLGTVCFLCRHKVEPRLPFSKTRDFEHRLKEQRERLSTIPWSDQRPLCLFLGDSQVELGKWYELFSGKHAVINAGVSMARVEDVAFVAGGGSASKIHTAVLMCGINDLGRGKKPADVLQDYRRLLDLVASKIAPRRTIILSVMPVAAGPEGEAGAALVNASVSDLNVRLASLARAMGCEFLDLTPIVSRGGGMNPDFTSDGLHPNGYGYSAIAAAVAGVLDVLPSGESPTNMP